MTPRHLVCARPSGKAPTWLVRRRQTGPSENRRGPSPAGGRGGARTVAGPLPRRPSPGAPRWLWVFFCLQHAELTRPLRSEAG